MATRYIGEAKVTVQFDGYYPPRLMYSGVVSVGRKRWKFSDIGLSEHVHTGAADSPEAYDSAAAAAVGFGSYYTTHNRGDDLPEWAPRPETADAIDDAVGGETDDSGRYAVRRTKNGKPRFTS